MSTYGLWLSAAGMKVHEHRQSVLAHNMANVETNGFKQDLAVVLQRRVESLAFAKNKPFVHPVLDDMPGGLHVRPSYTDLSQGSIEHTGRSLDVAIDGEGFLQVRAGDATRFTRDGRISINRSGELVVASGEGQWRVVGEGGEPIHVSVDGATPKVLTDGTVRQGAETVGRISFRKPAGEGALRKVGANMFEAQDSGMVNAAPRVVPEAIERSNFDVMSGLAQMIEVSRAYEFNATLLRLQDQATSAVVSRVGQLA